MKTTISTVAMTLVATASFAAKQPNVLVVMTDEQNFRTIGAYRATLSEEAAEPWGKGVAVDTPNLDRLAKMGALCTGVYATEPVSSASRSSLMTGMYPLTTHVITNDLHMNDELETFAETLLKRGYKTGYVGKWHLDGKDKPGWAPKAKFGFDDNKYMFNSGHFKVLGEEDGIPHVAKGANGKDLFAGSADDKSFTTDFLTDRALDFIDRNSDSSFCLMLSIPDPHTPNQVRKPYDTMYAKQTFNHPESVEASTTLPKWLYKANKGKEQTIVDSPKQCAAYWGMVKCIDDNMGRLLERLESKGILDNTIVVFTSDHGDMIGEHHRDNKCLPFEGSAKIPYIIYYKGVIKAGSVVPHAMNNADFAPTLLSMMGVDSGVKYEGRDCSELIVKNKLPKGWDNITPFAYYNAWVAATDGRYKIVLPIKPGMIDTTQKPALFDIVSDPLETKNFYGDKSLKEIADKLSKAAIAHAERYNLRNSQIKIDKTNK